MTRVRVRVSHIAVDLNPGEETIFEKDQEFECSEERAKQLGNSVTILQDPIPPAPPEQPPGKKRG